MRKMKRMCCPGHSRRLRLRLHARSNDAGGWMWLPLLPPSTLQSRTRIRDQRPLRPGSGAWQKSGERSWRELRNGARASISAGNPRWSRQLFCSSVGARNIALRRLLLGRLFYILCVSLCWDSISIRPVKHRLTESVMASSCLLLGWRELVDPFLGASSGYCWALTWKDVHTRQLTFSFRRISCRLLCAPANYNRRLIATLETSTPHFQDVKCSVGSPSS